LNYLRLALHTVDTKFVQIYVKREDKKQEKPVADVRSIVTMNVLRRKWYKKYW